MLRVVATVEENYLVGGQDTPAGFPGMAHAQEHMAFRGCAGLSADQISAIYAQLGGTVNAGPREQGGYLVSAILPYTEPL